MNILSFFKPITTFVFDVDGVLTNGTLLVLNDGQLARQMNIRDGYALQLAIKKGYHIVIISGGTSDAVKERLLKLGIADVFMKVTDKKELLQNYMAEHKLAAEEVLFMGDDIPDYAVMKICGLPCCPADAAPEIKSISKYISPVPGGCGCARDVIEKTMKLNSHWELDTDVAAK